MVQAELNFNDIRLNSESSGSNNFSLIFSGIYGINFGLKTNLLLSCYLSLPLDKEKSILGDNSFYHSPFTISEPFLPYPAMLYDITRTHKHDFITGVKVSAFHNISRTAGVSGSSYFNFGKTQIQKNDYTFNTRIRFTYNILTKLLLFTDVEYFRTNNVKSSFYSGVQLVYKVF